MEYLESTDDCFATSVIWLTVTKVRERSQFSDPLEKMLPSKDIEEEDEGLAELISWLDNQASSSEECEQMEPFLTQNYKPKINIPSIIKPPKLELKPFSKHLKYVFLEQSNILFVIIFALLTYSHEEKLLRILRDYKLSIRWTIADIWGIIPNVCMDKSLL